MDKKELLAINEKAREMKRNGNYQGIRALVVKNNFDPGMGEKYIKGELLMLSDIKKPDKNTPSAEELENITVIVPVYKSVEDKLESEGEDLLKDIEKANEKAVIKAQLKPIIDFVLSDDDLKAKAFLPWKELPRCYKYMTEKAKEFAVNKVACIDDATVFGWIKEYYNLDDQQEVETERKKEALQKKKTSTKKKSPAKKKPEIKKEETKPVKEKVEESSNFKNEEVEKSTDLKNEKIEESEQLSFI